MLAAEMKYLAVGILLALLFPAGDAKSSLEDSLTVGELNDGENEDKRGLGDLDLEDENEDNEQTNTASVDSKDISDDSNESKQIVQYDGVADGNAGGKPWRRCRFYNWGYRCATRGYCSNRSLSRRGCLYVVRTCRRTICGKWIKRGFCKPLMYMNYWRPCIRAGKLRICRRRQFFHYWRPCLNYYQRYSCTRCRTYTKWISR